MIWNEQPLEEKAQRRSNVCSMARTKYCWEDIQAFYDAGHSYGECRSRYGFSAPAWIKACRSGKFRVNEVDRRGRSDRRGNAVYDWNEVQRFYDEGFSFRECRLRFGFCTASWSKAVKRGAIRPRARGLPLERLLTLSRSRWTIKRRLLEAGILSNRCQECGISEWRGRPLSIQIDHRNGVRDDHRVENLRMLCPNCHSQTETFGVRNITKKRRSRVV